jgi:hypothetical protein
MIGSGNIFILIENQYHYSNILMMILDFHCRLGGNPICKNPSSSNSIICNDPQDSCCNTNGQFCTSWDYINNNSLLYVILSTTLPIIFVFGAIIGVIILWKYRANASALHEIQQGVFLFVYYSIVSFIYMIISCHSAFIVVTS